MNDVDVKTYQSCSASFWSSPIIVVHCLGRAAADSQAKRPCPNYKSLPWHNIAHKGATIRLIKTNVAGGPVLTKTIFPGPSDKDHWAQLQESLGPVFWIYSDILGIGIDMFGTCLELVSYMFRRLRKKSVNDS